MPRSSGESTDWNVGMIPTTANACNPHHTCALHMQPRKVICSCLGFSCIGSDGEVTVNKHELSASHSSHGRRPIIPHWKYTRFHKPRECHGTNSEKLLLPPRITFVPTVLREKPTVRPGLIAFGRSKPRGFAEPSPLSYHTLRPNPGRGN